MHVSIVQFAKTWIVFNVSAAYSLYKKQMVRELKSQLLLNVKHRIADWRKSSFKTPYYTKQSRAKDIQSDHRSHEFK